jgi:hypothetical protein
MPYTALGPRGEPSIADRMAALYARRSMGRRGPARVSAAGRGGGGAEEPWLRMHRRADYLNQVRRRDEMDDLRKEAIRGEMAAGAEEGQLKREALEERVRAAMAGEGLREQGLGLQGEQIDLGRDRLEFEQTTAYPEGAKHRLAQLEETRRANLAREDLERRRLEKPDMKLMHDALVAQVTQAQQSGDPELIQMAEDRLESFYRSGGVGGRRADWGRPEDWSPGGPADTPQRDPLSEGIRNVKARNEIRTRIENIDMKAAAAAFYAGKNNIKQMLKGALYGVRRAGESATTKDLVVALRQLMDMPEFEEAVRKNLPMDLMSEGPPSERIEKIFQKKWENRPLEIRR